MKQTFRYTFSTRPTVFSGNIFLVNRQEKVCMRQTSSSQLNLVSLSAGIAYLTLKTLDTVIHNQPTEQNCYSIQRATPALADNRTNPAIESSGTSKRAVNIELPKQRVDSELSAIFKRHSETVPPQATLNNKNLYIGIA